MIFTIGNEDYMQLDIFMEFAPQEFSKCFDIEIFNDGFNETQEVFEVVIEVDSPNVIIGSPSVFVIIRDSGKSQIYYSHNLLEVGPFLLRLWSRIL